MTADMSWMDDWTVAVGLSLERAGQAVLVQGRLELLEEIDRRRSISAAARQTGISYRHAWVTVQQVNEAAGEPLVEAVTGGKRGGGAHLTPQGRQAVEAFRDLQERLQRTASILRPGSTAAAAVGCVRVAAAVSLEEVLGRLFIDYAQQRPDVRIRTVFGASDELADQILEGAPADLFLSADARQLERLAARGAVKAGSAVPLVENTLVVLGPADGDAPWRSAADLTTPVVRRVALAAPSSPLGCYTRSYLERIGLYELLLSRAILVENAQAVIEAVRAGQADAGVAYGSATGTAAGARLLFRLEPAPAPIRYAGAVVMRGRRPDQAKSLLEFLGSEQAAERFRRCGFSPIHSTASVEP